MDEVIPDPNGSAGLRLTNRDSAPVHIVCWVAIALLLLGSPVFNQQQASRAAGHQPSEYEVKAAFLLNFTKFVEWPQTGNTPEAPLAICILGTDPFGATLDQTLQGERVNGRRLVAERVSRVQQSCAVLFVAKSEKNVARIVEETSPGVLTIGETDDFLKQGGMINFVLDNRRVRFDVSKRAVARGSLQISSRLLNVARSVVQ